MDAWTQENQVFMPVETSCIRDRPKILLIDDDPIYCAVFQKNNGSMADCHTAHDLKTLRQRLKHNHYQLVLLDYQLSEATAPEVVGDYGEQLQCPIAVISSSFSLLMNYQWTNNTSEQICGFLCKWDHPETILFQAWNLAFPHPKH